ncbi:OmpA family protein [Anianabacter salinae]|uniref:OmpA family protein n=1 Tax=Anianabacter salinae TaxID=2851023 RepID=UPI00225DE2C6|nr:OmpA family protein [Anianabacter salinae]MBV0913100.1 OmpA family protein [Anianabacter salinae]
MIRRTTLLASGLVGLLALTACTDPTTNGSVNDPNRRTKAGTAVGALTGGLLGAAIGGPNNRTGGAVVGAVAGGLAGAAIGSDLDRQAAELRQSLDNRVTIVNDGDQLIVTMPNDILFATDSATVSAGLQGDLRSLADSLQRYPGTIVEVVGHTDIDGPAAYNQDLSERRARAVANVLTASGVGSNRIQTYGMGETQPAPGASTLTAEGKAQSRRVEIFIRPN